jgi:EAL domain-containing protein (putative c-di-GMP-specific phosphodiesterase class I)
LSYLQKFDIDFIKIDQSFVRDLRAGTTDLVLCQAIIAMAHALGMKVIAEGVETAEQRDLLKAAGCDYAQGYFYSRPVNPAEFEAMVQRSEDALCLGA